MKKYKENPGGLGASRVRIVYNCELHEIEVNICLDDEVEIH